MADNKLAFLIYGYPIVGDKPVGESPQILAVSDGLSAEEMPSLRQRVPVHPLPVEDVLGSQSVALVLRQSDTVVRDMGNDYILARTHYQTAQRTHPVTQYVVVPGSVIYGLGGDIQPLIQLLDEPVPAYKVLHADEERLPVPPPATWTLDRGVALLKTLLDNAANGDIRLLLGTLGAALDKRGVLIRNFPQDWRQRLSLVRGLMMLLPTPARPHLTFTTHTTALDVALPRLIFSDSETSSDRWQIDWSAPDIDDALLETPYVAHLLSLWQDDMIALMETIRALDGLATHLMPGKTLTAGLGAVIDRHQQDLAVMRGDDSLTSEDMMKILTSDIPPRDTMRFKYVEHLLRRALQERNTAAAELVAQELDSDPELDERLWDVFEQVLEEQPDAVYVFVRARLSEGIDDRWLERLKRAAEQSLQVAIESGDPDTLASWLTLISREPARYQLADTLREGILRSRSRAIDSPELAQDLLTLAVKRQPNTLSTLLDDPNVMTPLPDTATSALKQNSEAIDSLAVDNRELFLLSLHRAQQRGTPCISPVAIRQLWDMHTTQNNSTLPLAYRPLTLIRELVTDASAVLNGGIETLLTRMLSDGYDDLFLEDVAPLLAAQDNLVSLLPTILDQSGRDSDDILQMMAALTTQEIITSQQAVDVYAALLSDKAWDDATLPLAEQLTRLLNQSPDSSVSPNMLWKMVERSGEVKNEQMVRVGTRRLLREIGEITTEAQLVENIRRLRRATQWSQNGREILITWWREYARAQPMVQLQKISRLLEGERALDDLESIIDTAIALRRVIGQRTLDEFAQDISTAYTILQSLAEGFDPDEKSGMTIDSMTIRNELNARADELPTDERHVLATNLKELAQLVTTLADNRSKASIMRSDDTIERQLVTGEQQPQSAIDVMRWLSGYLDGVQKAQQKQGE